VIKALIPSNNAIDHRCFHFHHFRQVLFVVTFVVVVSDVLIDFALSFLDHPLRTFQVVRPCVKSVSKNLCLRVGTTPPGTVAFKKKLNWLTWARKTSKKKTTLGVRNLVLAKRHVGADTRNSVPLIKNLLFVVFNDARLAFLLLRFCFEE